MDPQLRPRIVVGVHGSAASLAALRWAARQAELLGAHLHVVRAWEPDAGRVAPYAPHAGLPGRDESRALACAWLEEAVQAALASRPSVSATVEITDGLAARVLLDRAPGAELLVLGGVIRPPTSGIGPASRACLRHAPCPVVVVSVEKAQTMEPAT